MVRLNDRPDMTLDVYRGRKTTMQQQHHHLLEWTETVLLTKLDQNWPILELEF